MAKAADPAIIHLANETLVIDSCDGHITRLPKAANDGCYTEVHELAVELLRLAHRPRTLQAQVPANDNRTPVTDKAAAPSVSRKLIESESNAREILEEKLEYYLAAEAIAATPAERFQLRYLIRDVIEMLHRYRTDG